MKLSDSDGSDASALNISVPSRAWRPLLFELFVAFSLFVTYFYMVRNYFDYGNPMSANVFMAGSEKLYQLNNPTMGEHWNGRLSGLLLTGALMDFSLNENGAQEAQADRLTNIFGLYHACWLLLLFVCIIFALRYSLLVNLGIFAGLMYDFSPITGPNFYPWDFPAMFFFTLAVLFFGRRRMWPMAVAICVGSFFKETVLVCALLTFFAGQWTWKKRVLFFAGMVAVYFFGKRILMSGLHLEIPMLAMGDSPSLFQVLNPVSLASNFIENLKVLFSPTLNSVIFVNAGSVLAALVLCWQKRFLPYMVVILAYLAGLVFLPLKPAGITEVRVFMQILPLSFILLSTWCVEYAKTGKTAPSPSDNASPWAVREMFPLLLPLTIAVVVVSTSVVALQYYIIYEDLQPANQARSPLGKYVYQSGKPVSLEAVTQWYQNGYSDSELKLAIISQRDRRDADAIGQYQRVLDVDTNSIFALNNLATLLATDSDARLRDGDRAVRLAEQACELSQYHEPVVIYTLAAAYAEAGRFNDAVAAAEKARALALEQGQKEMANNNDALLELYKSGHAFHQQPPPPSP
jgi:hypothetical protein